MKRIKPDQFHFKKFSVTHKRSSMKVGTDGVLLGAWVNVTNVTSMLDIGTGTGVIALMLAQRTPSYVQVDAVELNPDACFDAQENFSQSPWRERLHLHAQAIQTFATEKTYDLIVSNPPYFNNSYKPPDLHRTTARHTEQLSFEELLSAVLRFLNASGRFAVVLPVTEGRGFEKLAMDKALYCIRNWNFRTRKNKPVERLLMEFSKENRTCETGEILLYESGEIWSDEYQNLMKDFYLKA
ncbi:MAG: methyltransferase [Cyclobacteriaceae bacterium]|nr:methyltransferase [Cyclobacteriaceae bacterium]